MLVAKLQLTLFIVLGFMMCVFVFTKNIVQEKELQIKVCSGQDKLLDIQDVDVFI